MEIQESTRKFAKRIVVLEAQCDQLKEEKSKLNEQVMEVKGKEKMMTEKYMKVKDKYAKVKEGFSTEKRKWREEEENLRDKCRQARVEKKKLEIDVRAAKRRITNVSVELTHKLMTNEEHFQSLLEESNGRITVILAKNEALDLHTSRLEMESMEAKKQVSELTHRIGVLERQKREIEAKFCSINREKSKDTEKTAVEAEKTTLEAEIMKKDELIGKLKEEVKAIKSMEKMFREKFESGERKWSEEVRKNEEKCRQSKVDKRKLEMDLKAALESNSRVVLDFEARIEKLKEEFDSERRKWFLNEKKVVEAEKARMEAENKTEVMELVSRIEVLEQEKRELEAEVCEAKREKSEEMKMILNKELALKEKHIMGLVSRCGVLERENQKLEAETRGKVQRTKVSVQEKQHLEAKKTKMVVEMNRRLVKPEKDVESPRQVHTASNAGILRP